MLQFAIENDHLEIVDLPINRMVIFQSYVNVYQRVIARLDYPLNQLSNVRIGQSPKAMVGWGSQLEHENHPYIGSCITPL